MNCGREILQKFIRLAGDQLEGEWVLLGGTLLPAMGIEYRVTTDIDFVGLTKKEKGQVLQLMKIAEKLNLSVESINQAAGFFLEKIQNFQKDLVILHQGKSARIYRPNATLYLILKIGRLTELDLMDCLEWLKFVRSQKEPLDTNRLQKAIEDCIKNCSSRELVTRLEILKQRLNEI